MENGPASHEQANTSTPLDDEELERLARELAGAYERAGEPTPEELAEALELLSEPNPCSEASCGQDDCEQSGLGPVELDRLVDALAAAQAEEPGSVVEGTARETAEATEPASASGSSEPAAPQAVEDAVGEEATLEHEVGEPELAEDAVEDDEAGGILESEPEPDFTPDLVQVVEGLLFVGGAPLDPAAVARTLGGVDQLQVERAVELLKRRYQQQGRPYRVARGARGYRLVLERSFTRYARLGPPRRRPVRLSQAAIDVLAIIAYKQPVGLREIDAMRGLSSAGVVRQLIRQGLVRPVAGSEGQRRVLYETTPAFLRVFRLTSLADLPRIDPAEATELPPPPHRRRSLERPTGAKAEPTVSVRDGRSG